MSGAWDSGKIVRAVEQPLHEQIPDSDWAPVEAIAYKANRSAEDLRLEKDGIGGGNSKPLAFRQSGILQGGNYRAAYRPALDVGGR
ncbi:MAG: hypothetical protein CL858_24715 [Cupriavidus sp.]|nr:hypothetical protein [Cupriavidus sp.]